MTWDGSGCGSRHGAAAVTWRSCERSASGAGQASGVINWQGFFLGLVAMLIGCPAGIIAGRLLWTAVAVNTNVLAVVDIPWSPIVAFGALVLASSAVLLAAGPAWTARRRSPGVDLRAE